MASGAEPTKSELKQQIRQLGNSIAEALAAKKSEEAKRLRRQKKRLKAVTRHLARTQKAEAAAKSEPPAAAPA